VKNQNFPEKQQFRGKFKNWIKKTKISVIAIKNQNLGDKPKFRLTFKIFGKILISLKNQKIAVKNLNFAENSVKK